MRSRLPSPLHGSPHAIAMLGVAACVVSTGGCAGCLGLYPEYDDGTGGAAASSGGTGPGAGSTSTTSSVASSTASSGGGGGAGGTSSTGGCQEADVFDDEFLDSVDPRWLQISGNSPATDAMEGFDYVAVDGSLLIGTEESQWYGGGEGGPFLYQEVQGDFFVWTRASATVDGEAALTDTYHGLGLLLREPNESPGESETFVMAAAGVGNEVAECEVGVTVSENGVSPPVVFTALHSCEADLAICRKNGETEIRARLTVGDEWEVIEGFTPPDDAFGDVLQIGPAVYAFDEAPEGTEPTVGAFELIAFESTCGRSCEEIFEAIEGE